MSEAPGKIEGMDELAATLSRLEELGSEVAAACVSGSVLRSADEASVVAVLASAARVQRMLDAVLIEATGEVVERSDSPVTEGRMIHRFGCHNVAELVQRATLVGPVTAGRLIKAAKAVHQDQSVMTGELLEPMLPAVRAALGDGVVGVDGLLAIAAPLQALGSRVSRDALLTADTILAAEARGEGPDAAPPACADLLRIQAQVWAIALDPDGAEPRERAAMHKRGLTLGTPTDYGVPIRGMLIPEIAAQFRRIADAVLNPRVEGDRLPGVHFTEESETSQGSTPVDLRTRAQQLHDVFATVLTVAASSKLLPTIGGAAPTLVVTVREEDLLSGRGYAHVDGAEQPVALTAARHTGCAGVIQRVALSDGGRIRSLGTDARVFNRRQRRAIAARDGGCVIPGCGVCAAWCEIHHVTEHANGGPTHTDNGVLLCWYHHRFIEFSGWKIRMNNGIPEIKAPAWLGCDREWRPTTTSPTRLLNAVLRT